MKSLLCTLVCLVAFMPLAFGTPGQDNALAIKAYDDGQFAEAAAQFEKVVSAIGGQNGDVFYNLGNAYFKAGAKGAAVAAYLAAARLLPRNPDVKANLTFTQRNALDKLGTTLPENLGNKVFFWTTSVTLKEQAYAAVVLFCFAGLLVGGFLASRTRLFYLGMAAGVFGALSLVIVAGFAFAWSHERPWGAVTVVATSVYASPSSKHETALFELHEGAPFAMMDSNSEWYFVQLSDGKKGWLPKAAGKVF